MEIAKISGTIDVLDNHRFATDRLDAFLAENVPGFGRLSALRQFRWGQSNPTFLLESTGGLYVLRKKPPGDLLKSAHRIDREYRVMAALANSEVPVPKMLVYCQDETIIGTEFYVMSYVPGRTDGEPRLPDLPINQRRDAYFSLAKTLAKIHAVDLERSGLADFSKQTDYARSQISIWSRQYAATKTEHIESMEAVAEWLSQNIPGNTKRCLVHGDFRAGNVIFDPDIPQIAAVLDWELSTIGEPLADLAYLLMPYELPAGVRGIRGLVGVDLIKEGLPSREEVIAAYNAQGEKVNLRELRFFQIFAMFRLAAILQGVYARSLAGNASSADAPMFARSVRILADRAVEITNQV
jgi:aminoglycoside phosphotransferase (APT) family kinase protein